MYCCSHLERSCYYFQDEDVRSKLHQSPPRPGVIDHGRGQDQKLSPGPRPGVIQGSTPAPIPLGFTTTRRPVNISPRVKSNIRQQQHRNNHPTPNPISRPSPPPEDDRRSFVNVPPLIDSGDNDPVEDVTVEPVVNPFDNPPFISADGKKPRVKANLNSNKFSNNISGKLNKFEKSKKQGSKKVELDRSQFHNINFVSPTPPVHVGHVSEDARFSGPEVRPDGRVPRVKSNVLAAARVRDQGQVSTPGPFVTTSPTPRLGQARPSQQNLEFNSINGNGLDLQTQSVSPSTIRNIFPSNDVTISGTPEPIFSSTLRSTFDDVTGVTGSTFRPFSADPPRFSILSATPANIPRLPSSTQPPRRPSRPRPNKFADLGPPPQPKIPASLAALLPPPPTRLPASVRTATRAPAPVRTPVPQPRLQQDRKRFGSRPRVKANELAQKAKSGNKQQQITIEESPRNSFSQSQAAVVRPSSEEIVPGSLVSQRPRSRPRPSRPKFNVRFKTRNDITLTDPCINNPFKCPPRKSADGRKPRVKSNIKAARRNFWHPRKGRVIKKQRKQGKLNAALWNRGIIRQGRKQSLSQDKSAVIDNSIDDDPITTQDPIRSLKQIVASKEKLSSTKAFEAFPAARSFQNKRLRSKQKINHRGREDAFQGTTFSPNEFRTTPTPLSIVEQTTAASTTTKLSLFVTNPNFAGDHRTTPASLVSRAHSPLSVLPGSNPTQSAPQSPFTQPDMGLFVTNPRALPEQHRDNEPDEDRNLFGNPTTNNRRPRVKSNIMAKLQNSPRGHGQQDGHRQHTTPGENVIEEDVITTTEAVKPVLRIVPDGRSPRVKSNLLNKSSNRKHNQKNKKHKFRGSGRRKFGRSLDLSTDSNNEIDDISEESYVDFEDDVDDNIDNDDDDYTEPEVRPDGRKARIKSNILAKKMLHRKNSAGEVDNQPKKKGKSKWAKSGFRHSKKVAKPTADISFRSTDETAPNSAMDDNLIDGTDNAITTFRPVISLEQLMNTNETFPSPSPVPPPPPPASELSVPLPNFDKSTIARESSEDKGRGFEPHFSDMTNNIIRDTDVKASRLPVQSVTEIVRVSSKDKNLFNSDYSYYDYYEEFINSSST